MRSPADLARVAEQAEDLQHSAVWVAVCEALDRLANADRELLQAFPCEPAKADFLRGEISGILRAKMILGDVKRATQGGRRGNQ